MNTETESSALCNKEEENYGNWTIDQRDYITSF